jgi:hypothetical protein
MNILNGILVFLAGSLLLLIFVVVATFIVVGAIKLYKARESLSKIDVSDGLDESEIQLIRDALLRKKQMDADVQEKAKLVAASQKLAEVAKAP